MSRVREIDIKSRTYYFFDDLINTKNLDLSNMKIVKKIYKSFLIYPIGLVTPNSV